MTNPKVKALFSELQNSGRKALIPFLTAGYPSVSQTERLARVALDSGADLLELGAPFTDPLADGPSIQYSSQCALDSGLRLRDLFSLAERISSKTDKPLFVMGYMNPLIARGFENYMRSAADAGISGLIIPDLPPDEAGEALRSAKRHNISLTFLVAPTSEPNRVSLVDRASSDFVYAVTVAGVTGARSGFTRKTDRYLDSLRLQLKKPFVAGFGVSSPESARRLASRADGVVIGSALVDIIRSRNRREAERRVGAMLLSIRTGLDKSFSGPSGRRKSV